MTESNQPPASADTTARLAYVKPELRVYGTVEEITAANGSPGGGFTEGGNPSGFCQANPTYPACRSN